MQITVYSIDFIKAQQVDPDTAVCRNEAHRDQSVPEGPMRFTLELSLKNVYPDKSFPC